MLTLLLTLVSLVSADWTFLPTLNKSVVRIEIMEDGSKGTCSGIVIHKVGGMVLTAGHCASGKDPQFTVNGRHAVLVKRNEIIDLAILHFKAKDEESMPLASVNPVMGEEIAILGFAFGVKLMEAQMGHVSIPVDEEGLMHVDAMIIAGDSGGPVVNAKGELIGVNSAIRYYGPMHQSVIVTREAVEDFAGPYFEKK